jgi:sterol desaturase/sphingolipid hydroxylase (fatty acid hydroxylase superfamily)
MEFLEQLLDPKTGVKWELLWSSLAALNAGVRYALASFIALDLVLFAQHNSNGLLNLIEPPGWASLLLGVVWLDFVSYATHRLSHAVPIFWRIHRLNYSDPDVDLSTSRRHHPLETFIATPILALGFLVSGAPPLSLLVWGALFGVLSVIQHGNICLPAAFDRCLRLILVTPNMHRIHHSSTVDETDSNFSQLFPW